MYVRTCPFGFPEILVLASIALIKGVDKKEERPCRKDPVDRVGGNMGKAFQGDVDERNLDFNKEI